jgi:membrane protease YdiL (CAAX protease family)
VSTQPEGDSAADRREARDRAAAARLVRTAGIFYAVLLGLAVAWRTGWAGEPLWFAGPEAAARGVAWLRDPALGAAAAALVIVVSGELTERAGWGQRLARHLAELVGRPSPGQIALLALSSGIAEEAFFRGALQPRVGLVAASLLFGLAHFVPRRELLPWTGFSVVAGFLLGGLFEGTGNLLAPIVAHVGINGVNLTLLVRRYGPRRGRS